MFSVPVLYIPPAACSTDKRPTRPAEKAIGRLLSEKKKRLNLWWITNSSFFCRVLGLFHSGVYTVLRLIVKPEMCWFSLLFSLYLCFCKYKTPLSFFPRCYYDHYFYHPILRCRLIRISSSPLKNRLAFLCA